MWTLKNGGKMVVEINDDTFDIVSEHWEGFRRKPLIANLRNEKGDLLSTVCIIESLRAKKKGATFLVILDDGAIGKVTKEIKLFRKIPIEMELQVDTEKFKEEMDSIQLEQRKKIYAIFRDIGRHTGQVDEDVKMTMKPVFLEAYTQHSEFSLSNCSKELAGDFITYLIIFCFKQGIPLKDHPREAFDDIESYLWVCVKANRCCACGKEGHIHIANGKKISLCDEHAQEWQSTGREFYLKYHVKPIEV